jgi:hypothetical protein
MRLVVRVLLLGTVALGVGCTFLIDFDEVTSKPDTGSTDDDAGDALVAFDAKDSMDAKGTDGGPVAFPPPCDPMFPLDQVVCNPSYPRPNCASNTTVFPAFPAGHPRNGDLVTCNGGAHPTCDQHCPFGCFGMPTGFPDICDDCNGRTNGTYCMKDLRGPDGRNLGFAVDCDGGKTVMVHQCGVGNCATMCPRADPKPSCCI